MTIWADYISKDDLDTFFVFENLIFIEDHAFDKSLKKGVYISKSVHIQYLNVPAFILVHKNPSLAHKWRENRFYSRSNLIGLGRNSKHQKPLAPKFQRHVADWPIKRCSARRALTESTHTCSHNLMHIEVPLWAVLHGRHSFFS